MPDPTVETTDQNAKIWVLVNCGKYLAFPMSQDKTFKCEYVETVLSRML